MPFTFDFLDGDVLRWTATEDGAECERDTDYTPTLYVTADTREQLTAIQPHVERFTGVAATAFEPWRRGFRHEAESVLRVDVESVDAVTSVGSDIRGWGPPGEYRLYNVDFSREFRYCLERELDPTPDRSLRMLSLEATVPELAGDPGLSAITVDGAVIEGDPPNVAATVAERVQAADPDVLRVSESDLLAQLHAVANAQEWDYQLGRIPGFQQLAGQSTFESYGRVGHSPARYNVPGRAIVDEANTFFLREANLDGCLDLVARSRKPLQETAWASIGNILTAIQIREARRRNVLVPWKAWRPERFKTMRQLDDADRGGFTFAPDVGLHEDVHELDFSSLYPSIMITRNISPETVRCDCHQEREDVPGLGYSICDEPGYLPDVLEPLVTDRQRIKTELADCDDPERRADLEGRSDAIKWILVSCFGYQGFNNAKFGRIACHEAINAFAREILLDAKERLEASGWQVVHGIVDSIWVTPATAEPTALETVAGEITDAVGIELEYEAAYDWAAFVPLRNSDAGALTKYFGRVADTDRYKYRGIECRQHSTPPFIAEAQRELIRTLDATRSPEAVCDRLARFRSSLKSGEIDSDRLLIEKRVSKGAGDYERFTQTAAALDRAASEGINRHPGQRTAYVVVDDDATTADRVRLAHEEGDRYDADYYDDLLCRAAESVLSPLGWREAGIRQYCSDMREPTLAAFGN
ncbi:type B DNA-directed DNA polymerase [Haloglomus halophilum]|uniref:type B DNA-directed DNA polymerase n=1 Tax=Haloglomus halophilum TaxID=2962672 RepID=UPI0020C9BC2E|nr:type B DNA-directed DNA polymerase [Haloglomus halophilum]